MRAEALRLKAEGLSVRQIAVRLGVPRSTVGAWVKPHRACPECGAKMGHAGHRHEVCRNCWADSEHRRTLERAEQIAEWWDAGLSLNEIAARLGWSRGHLANEFDRIRTKSPALLPYRNRGYDRAGVRRVAV